MPPLSAVGISGLQAGEDVNMGTDMALAATAAPFRRLRRRVLLLLCVIVVSFYMGCLDHPDPPSWEERCMS